MGGDVGDQLLLLDASYSSIWHALHICRMQLHPRAEYMCAFLFRQLEQILKTIFVVFSSFKISIFPEQKLVQILLPLHLVSGDPGRGY